MRSIWTHRRLFLPAIFSLLMFPFSAPAQKGGSAGGASSGSSAGAASAGSASGSRGTATGNPGIGTGNTTYAPSTTPAPIFLSGAVIFDDGSPTSTEIRIERICGGATRLEAHTDSKGRFSFQVGQNPMALDDAADASSGMTGNRGASGLPTGFGNMSSGNATQSNPLWNCELRASFPGYRSDTIDLSTRHALDQPDVGTLVLHRLGNVQGSTISMTTELAPKPALKAYQKGLKAAQNGKAEDAEKDFEQATQVYPKYALAWFALGQTQQQAGKLDLAKKSYLAATEADSKYLSPYDRLAYLAAQEGKWEDTADYSKHVIDLNPVEFPTSFWYNAIANFNLRKPALAEQSDAALLKLDTQHKFPQAEYMMAQLLLDKNEYAQAATHLRTYLQLQPNAKDADALKAALTKIDQASAQAKPAGPPQ